MRQELIDRFGRKHDYLRISITDRCNLRCVYCMGPEGVSLLERNQILRYEEIIKVVKAGAQLGITKIRLTGGEPLIRKGVEGLIGKIAAIPGIRDISLTTNGQMLSEKAFALKKAGLKRVNISLDSLVPETYSRITRGGDLYKVREGIRIALELGLHPVKLNVVLMKGTNEGEIQDFLQLAVNYPLHLRFIEYMPVDSHDKEWKDKYLPLDVVKYEAEKMGYTLEPLKDLAGAGPAEIFKMPGALGTIGLIHPISRHFCSSCNRLRLTADGFIKPCLYWQEELSVKPFLNNPEELKNVFAKALEFKRQKHLMGSFQADLDGTVAERSMSKIGG